MSNYTDTSTAELEAKQQELQQVYAENNVDLLSTLKIYTGESKSAQYQVRTAYGQHRAKCAAGREIREITRELATRDDRSHGWEKWGGG
jgi:predicted transposase YdaD